MSSRSHGGRIHAGQRQRNNNTNNNNETIDDNINDNNIDDIQILPEHTAGIAVTVDHAQKEATRNDYRNRLQRMVNWCFQHYKDDVPKFIQEITDEERSDPTKHFHRQTWDFMYAKLPPGIIMAFLSTVRKENENGTGKTRSYTHIRKFYDAILFGAREQGTSLPCTKTTDFHQTIDNYLKSFKKEAVVAKKKGEVEEIDADPMPFPLYVALCTWSV